MRTGRTWKTLTVLTVLIGLIAVAGPARADDHGRKVWYLALGDSLSVGVQPDAANVNHPTTFGYADQLHQALKGHDPQPRAEEARLRGHRDHDRHAEGAE